jgi:predicted dehydrogenase
MNKVVGVGLVGCGYISGEYLKRAARFSGIRVVACADILPEVAKSKAGEFGIPRACTVEELLTDDDVQLVLNLAVPKAHGPVGMAALNAGKHLYTEKPLAISRLEGMALLAKAKEKRLLIGCAPDTFMGSGLQTARKVIDDGRIGRPVGFNAFMMCPGHEAWHPTVEFHYEPGGGPMFDMGPYYLTALLNLLGPVKRLCGMAAIELPERVMGAGPNRGKILHVQTPDHVAGVMEFQNGAVGTITQSFATHHGPYSAITIFGTEGSLQVPDPNNFTGSVKLRLKDDSEWQEIPPVFTHDYGRAVGMADMAEAITTGRPFRATGEQGMNVLDLMQGFLDSSAQGKMYEPVTRYERPAPMPAAGEFGDFVD